MKKYEYEYDRILKHKIYSRTKERKFLNKKGLSGWELYSIYVPPKYSDIVYIVYHLRRKIKS